MMQLDFYAYETYCMIRIEASEMGKEFLTGARDIAMQVQDCLNMYDPTSELSVLCRCYVPGRPMKVSNMLLGFLERNQQAADICRGGFEPAIGELTKMWGFGSNEGQVPEENRILQACGKTGIKDLHMNKVRSEVIFDKEGILLDPGASGKGYAINLVKDFLIEKGVQNFQIDFGGNLYVHGSKVKVMLRNSGNGEVDGKILEIHNEAVSTSASYEHWFESEGKKYSHLINPKTGYPVENNFISVTVVCEDAVLADAVSTAIYILGESEGRGILEDIRKTVAIRGILLWEGGNVVEI